MLSINGKDCSEVGIVFDSLPSIPKPFRNIEERMVSGRDGALIIDKGTYQDIPIVLTGHGECSRTALLNYFGEHGEVIFETLPGRIWKYRVSTLDVSEILGNEVLLKFSLGLYLHPYKYLSSGKNKIVGQNSLILNNIYNAKAYPLFKIIGSGAISIRKDGSEVLKINGVVDYVEVDCEADVIHRAHLGMDKNAVGDTFFIDAGKQSTISVTGNVISIECIPNWREL